MNSGVPPPPHYNDVMNNNGAGIIMPSEVRGGWCMGTDQAYTADYQHIFAKDYSDDIRKKPGLRRSESRSSCSSGGSSIRLVGNGSGLYTETHGSYNPAKDLPPGWEIRFLSSGRMYYSHLPTDTHHWNHPLEKTDLPPGWERVYNTEYGEYYVNHVSKTAQFTHPGSLPTPVSGEQHAQALVEVKLRKLQQDKAHSSTYVPPSQYLCEEIPLWLQEYAISPDEEYEWSGESYQNLDKYQTMMTRLYRQELRKCIEKYEEYRNRIIKELEDRMQLHALNPAQPPAANQNTDLETFV